MENRNRSKGTRGLLFVIFILGIDFKYLYFAFNICSIGLASNIKPRIPSSDRSNKQKLLGLEITKGKLNDLTEGNFASNPPSPTPSRKFFKNKKKL